MDACEVLIVGGGPSGSSCAWKLRQSGIDVVVLDKASFPRHKVCAGWITTPIVDELKIDVLDYRVQRVLQPISRFVTGLIEGPEVQTDYARTVSYGIRRCEFDDYLVRRSGARLQLGEPFQSMRRDGTDWIVNDKYRARIVVGAGGHFCPVARQLSAAVAEPEGRPRGTDHRGLPVVMAQEVEFEMSEQQQRECAVQPDRPELLFCPDLMGYGWVFRKGNFLNIGLGREAEEHLSAHVSRFVEFLRSRGKVTFPITARFQGHAYCLRTKLPDPKAEDGVLLIGDAVGLADRQSGEGIRPAIESGLIAAECILEGGSHQRNDLSAVYRGKLAARFPSASRWQAASAWIPAALRRFAAQQLMSTQWFARRILLDRWFLHLAEPPLKSA